MKVLVTGGAVYIGSHTCIALLDAGHDVVVLDNLAAHYATAARAAVEARGARLMFLPQYSPELNPIEEAWSKVKSVLRALEARTVKALDAAIVKAVGLITPSDAAGYFRHAGYQVIR